MKKPRCLYALLFIQCTVPEPSNIVDKYAVSVQGDGEVVGHLMKSKSSCFAKTVFYFLRAEKKNNCTLVVTGKAVNRGDKEGMQVPYALHFKGHQKFIDVLKKESSGKA